jgi:hypothetical protein
VELRQSVVDYKERHLRWRFRHGEIELENLLQGRLTRYDEDGFGSESNAQLRRARTEIVGWLGTKRLEYEIQVDWKEVGLPELDRADDDGLRNVFLEDADEPLDDLYVDWDVTGNQRFRLRAGQFTVPFGRQRLISSTRHQFVDRSLVSTTLTGGRDIGLWLRAKGPNGFAYQVGVFNGQGKGELENEAGRYQYDGRLAWEPWGELGLEEADRERSANRRFALGVSLQRNEGRATDEGLARWTGWAADAGYKHRGWSLFAEVLGRDLELPGRPEERLLGWQTQAGRMLWKDRLEAALRYAHVEREGTAQDETEYGVAVSWFVLGHDLKLVGDLRQIDRTGRAGRFEARLQAQVTF